MTTLGNGKEVQINPYECLRANSPANIKTMMNTKQTLDKIFKLDVKMFVKNEFASRKILLLR
ncbi:CLUMA_CG009736, isoform A [Clunio marinus]|uniref:CLUMA_CG009736, isoform A n=1 Tax=Clunio marinus TaxID=568069 RepID=A0A1J1I7Q0_9DIPT|nr:CLUMA_CG009736, isoform A [Clunio marinus]